MTTPRVATSIEDSAPTWLRQILSEHVIPTQGSGGTAYESYCPCSCGERNAIDSGLRSQALSKARAHVAEVIWGEIERRLDTEACYGGDDYRIVDRDTVLDALGDEA